MDKRISTALYNAKYSDCTHKLNASMRKIAFLLMFVIALSTLCSCDNFGRYNHEDNEHFTEATSSLLGVTGNLEDKAFLLETDKYGRTMFAYHGITSDTKRIIALLISQKVDSGYVYYYFGCNYIFHPTGTYSTEFSDDSISDVFTEDEIKDLKNANDWDKEIVEEKLFRTKIYDEKSSPLRDKIVEKAFSAQRPSSEFSKPYSMYLTSDKDSNSVYFVRGVDKEHKFTKSYIIFLDKKGNFDKEKGIEEVVDIWDYSDQLNKFLDRNGWEKYYK